MGFYNLVEWFGGSLPWDRECASPELTKTAKFMAFRQMGKFLRICFRGKKVPNFLVKFMKYVNNLMFEDEPDYDYLRGIVYEEMVNSGCKIDNKLDFKLAPVSTSSTDPLALLEPNLLFGPSKKPPSSRVSKVFDTMCTSATSFEQKRESVWAKRSEASLDNPTPAMIEVIRLKKLKSMDDANLELYNNPPSAVALPNPYIQLSPCPVIPYHVVYPDLMEKKQNMADDDNEEEKDILFRTPTCSGGRRKASQPRTELKRLSSFLDDPIQRRRTRSEAGDREIRSLRSALNFGFAPVRNFMKQVSGSLQRLF